MKIRLAGMLLFSNIALAAQMSGFGANYYESNTPQPTRTIDTQDDITPEIIVGENIYTLEMSQLSEISHSTGIRVNQGEQAAWLCIRTNNINYWFISDNEMGQGVLTMVGMARDGDQQGCIVWNGDVRVSIKGWPLLSMPVDRIEEGGKPAVQYCKETPRYSDYTQLNCLQYYFGSKKVRGVFISQVTTN